jgi:hypothetical protein
MPDSSCAKIALARPSRARMALAALQWSLATRGIGGTARRAAEVAGVAKPRPKTPRPPRDDEVLGLRPGEVVEVKSADEIRETLDGGDAYRGLLFMAEMWKYCGQRFAVRSRIDRLMVESTGQLRSGIRNTVLLEGANCDGSKHEGCGAACFHLWREVWLRRVDDEDSARL